MKSFGGISQTKAKLVSRESSACMKALAIGEEIYDKSTQESRNIVLKSTFSGL